MQCKSVIQDESVPNSILQNKKKYFNNVIFFLFFITQCQLVMLILKAQFQHLMHF